MLHSRDPITTEKVIGGKHVGKTIYVDRASLTGAVRTPDFSAHEHRKVRDLMLKSLKNRSIPALAIRYRKMEEINPGHDPKKKGSPEELRKLSDSFKNYYFANGIWLNSE